MGVNIYLIGMNINNMLIAFALVQIIDTVKNCISDGWKNVMNGIIIEQKDTNWSKLGNSHIGDTGPVMVNIYLNM